MLLLLPNAGLPSKSCFCEMSRVPPIQIFSTAVGLLCVALAYRYRRKGKTPAPYDQNDGLDPNFPGGKPIHPDSPVDSHDYFRPSCQVWNNEQNLFENAGHPTWDVSQTACFVNSNLLPADQRNNVRYVDGNGNMAWKGDEFGGSESERGLCRFYDGKNISTFPDIGESHIAPPNRTTRLCFNSGSTQDNTGQQFDSRSDPSYHVWNPEVAFVPYATAVGKALGYQRYWGLNLGDGNFDLLPGPSPMVDHCQSLEELQFFPDPALGPTPGDILEAWVPKASIQNLKTPQTCAVNQYQRFWQPSQQKIIYFDPNDSQLVETPLLSFDNGPVPGKK